MQGPYVRCRKRARCFNRVAHGRGVCFVSGIEGVTCRCSTI